MSKIPSQIKKAVVGAAKVVSAPARGANLGISHANNKGKGPLGVAAAAAKGLVAGVKHPNKINAAAKFAATGPQNPAAIKGVHAIKKSPGTGGVVNVKFKPNAPMEGGTKTPGPGLKSSGSSSLKSSSSSQSQ